MLKYTAFQSSSKEVSISPYYIILITNKKKSKHGARGTRLYLFKLGSKSRTFRWAQLPSLPLENEEKGNDTK